MTKISDACEAVYEAFQMCAATRWVASKKKIYTSHINEGFIEEDQVDFTSAEVYEKKREIMNIVDMGMLYVECVISDGRTTDEIKRKFETPWFYMHGAPKRLSADHEFCRKFLRKYLLTQVIQLKPGPSR